MSQTWDDQRRLDLSLEIGALIGDEHSDDGKPPIGCTVAGQIAEFTLAHRCETPQDARKFLHVRRL